MKKFLCITAALTGALLAMCAFLGLIFGIGITISYVVHTFGAGIFLIVGVVFSLIFLLILWHSIGSEIYNAIRDKCEGR